MLTLPKEYEWNPVSLEALLRPASAGPKKTTLAGSGDQCRRSRITDRVGVEGSHTDCSSATGRCRALVAVPKGQRSSVRTALSYPSKCRNGRQRICGCQGDRCQSAPSLARERSDATGSLRLARLPLGGVEAHISGQIRFVCDVGQRYVVLVVSAELIRS